MPTRDCATWKVSIPQRLFARSAQKVHPRRRAGRESARSVEIMRILVTGGAGFIGSHVVTALADAGHAVRVLDALLETVHPDAQPAIDGRAEFVKGDVRIAADCRQA